MISTEVDRRREVERRRKADERREVEHMLNMMRAARERDQAVIDRAAEREKIAKVSEGIAFLGKVVRSIGKKPRHRILWEKDDACSLQQGSTQEPRKEIRH